MSGCEVQPRKVELKCTHPTTLSPLHITTRLVIIPSLNTLISIINYLH